MDRMRREKIDEVYDKWEKRRSGYSTANTGETSNWGMGRRKNGYTKGGERYQYRRPQQPSTVEPRQARYKTRLEKQSREEVRKGLLSLFYYLCSFIYFNFY